MPVDGVGGGGGRGKVDFLGSVCDPPVNDGGGGGKFFCLDAGGSGNGFLIGGGGGKSDLLGELCRKSRFGGGGGGLVLLGILDNELLRLFGPCEGR